jgi:hypothetical protein
MRSYSLFLALALTVFASCSASAQNEHKDSEQQEISNMIEQMRNLMEQMQGGGGFSFSFPEMGSDSSFSRSFRFDTTITSDQLFRNMPFSDGQNGAFGSDFFRQFEQMQRMLEGSGMQEGGSRDDGEERHEDEPLPEEQLRQSEEESSEPQKPAKKHNTKQKARKTTRI